MHQKEKRAFKGQRSFHTEIVISKSQPSLLWLILTQTSHKCGSRFCWISLPVPPTEGMIRRGALCQCAGYKCIMCMQLDHLYGIDDPAGGVTRPDRAPQFSERSRVALETVAAHLGVATGNSTLQPYLHLCLPTVYSRNGFINPWTRMFNVQGLW